MMLRTPVLEYIIVYQQPYLQSASRKVEAIEHDEIQMTTSELIGRAASNIQRIDGSERVTQWSGRLR
jgi:hypothetical protein